MSQDGQSEAPCGVEEVEWHWLRPHHDREAVWVVVPSLALETAVAAVAADDAARVRAWLADGSLARPTEAQLAVWNANPLTRLRMMIVQPFVLIQEPDRKE